MDSKKKSNQSEDVSKNSIIRHRGFTHKPRKLEYNPVFMINGKLNPEYKRKPIRIPMPKPSKES